PHKKNQTRHDPPPNLHCMATPRPEKKREPAEPTVLPADGASSRRPHHRRDRRMGSHQATVHDGGGKDRPRASPENQRARQLGDTKLGRFQAHQRGAGERRRGQAITRLTRRASLLLAFSLLTSTTTAYRVCWSIAAR